MQRSHTLPHARYVRVYSCSHSLLFIAKWNSLRNTDEYSASSITVSHMFIEAVINSQTQITQHSSWHRVSGISDKTRHEQILFFVNMYIFKFSRTGGQVRKWDTSDVFVWHPGNLGKNPGFGASCHGQLTYPMGLLTKWSTLICFPSEEKKGMDQEH